MSRGLRKNSDLEDNQFQVVDSGASDCTFIQGGSIKKGGYCLIRNNPCKVIQTAISKPGKHGTSKIHVVGTDIFTNKKYQDIFTTDQKVASPVIKKQEFQVVNINADDYVDIIINSDIQYNYLKLPAEDELRRQLLDCYEEAGENAQVLFTVLEACGRRKFVFSRTKDW